MPDVDLAALANAVPPPIGSRSKCRRYVWRGHGAFPWYDIDSGEIPAPDGPQPALDLTCVAWQGAMQAWLEKFDGMVVLTDTGRDWQASTFSKSALGRTAAEARARLVLFVAESNPLLQPGAPPLRPTRH